MDDVHLRLRNLAVGFEVFEGFRDVLSISELCLARGEAFGLVGESGAGKTVLALALQGLLQQPPAVVRADEMSLDGMNLLEMRPKRLREIRGSRIAMVFQDPMSSLDPVYTIHTQMADVIRCRCHEKGKTALEHILQYMRLVELPDPELLITKYPHQLSGGQRQRVVIALALACGADLLVADEPTRNLDVTVQASVVKTIARLRRELGVTLLFIANNLALVSAVCDRVAVLLNGRIVEVGKVQEILEKPAHPYTRMLLRAVPRKGEALIDSETRVPGGSLSLSECLFASRCEERGSACQSGDVTTLMSLGDTHQVACAMAQHSNNGRRVRSHAATVDRSTNPRVIPGVIPGEDAVNDEAMLEVSDVKIHFAVRRGLLKRPQAYVRAVDGISVSLTKGGSLALVGESGSGKTTLSNAICMIELPTAGKVRFKGRDLDRVSTSERRELRRSIQIVFQDPFWSLDPRWLVRDIVGEPIKAHYHLRGNAYQSAVVEALELVGLGASQLFQYPHELTGGVRQRVAIARALSAKPELLVLDEPTSAIDVLSQHQILMMLQSLKESLGLTFVLVSHDLSVVGYLATSTAVMYAGLLVEYGRTEDVFAAPVHPYTKAMLGAVPTFGSYGADSLVSLPGEVASALDPPDGCRFHPRCQEAMEVCAHEAPPRVSAENNHYAYCWSGLT